MFKWTDPPDSRNGFAVLRYIKGVIEPGTRILNNNGIRATTRLQQEFAIIAPSSVSVSNSSSQCNLSVVFTNSCLCYRRATFALIQAALAFSFALPDATENFELESTKHTQCYKDFPFSVRFVCPLGLAPPTAPVFSCSELSCFLTIQSWIRLPISIVNCYQQEQQKEFICTAHKQGYTK